MKKLTKNLLLVMTMVLLCFAVSVGASALNAEYYFDAGVADRNTQTIICFDLNSGTLADPVNVYDDETGTFKEVENLTGVYVKLPMDSSSQVAGSYINLPRVKAPDRHTFDGWYCYNDGNTYAGGSSFRIPEGYEGGIIEFMADYSLSGPQVMDKIGDNLEWTFDETTGTLTISGEGEMYDETNYSIFPWHDDRSFLFGINKVVIEDGVTSIGEYAFRECISLSEISIPESVISIGEDAFNSCFSLKEIVIPDNVASIESYTFASCYVLEKVTLPRNLKSIASAAFITCFNLSEIEIPESVEEIGELAFHTNCFLEDYYIKSMDITLSYPICVNELKIEGISREEFAPMLVNAYFDVIFNGNQELAAECQKYIVYLDEPEISGTLHCHSGSTAEAYAKENGMDYVPTHFFEGEWTYDYDQMIRYRKCIHCDELEKEKLETTTEGDVEIIEPTNPDTEFEVDEITPTDEDYIIIDEAIGDNGLVVKAFEINLKNKDGVHVQPDGTVKVKLPLDWSKNGEYKVYRVEDDGTLTDMNAYRQGSHMVFDTDHFSKYVIVDISSNPELPPSEDTTTPCDCPCHSNPIVKLVYTIINFIMKLFGKAPCCDC